MFKAALYIAVFLVCAVVHARSRSQAVRQAVLLLGSYILYLTWSRWFFFVLLGSTLMNFFLGQWMRRRPSGTVLSLGIVLNLALLSAFKYLPEGAVSLPFASLQSFAHIVLPLGISFWTFQAMSYLFDLYREEELDPSFTEFALYMAFFPVVISGPICRMPDMLPQFRATEPTPPGSIERGLARVATGVLMMQLAQLLGRGILGGDGILSGYDRVNHWGGADVWCLAFGYGLQLFFDFAGYSHIAIGAAQALGLVVPENFARPFQSTSPSIFWTRWHMSLSFWIRDYVFLPLATLRREMWWRNLALVIAMVAFGVWHKASVLFVLWGAYHGVLLVLHRQVQQLERRFDFNPPEALWNAVSWLATISLISLGWIFFRANSLPQARQMFAALVSPASYASHTLTLSLYGLVLALAAGYALVVATTAVLDRHSVQQTNAPHIGIVGFLARKRWYWLPPLYALLLIFVLLVTLTQGENTAQFMYRKF